MGNRVVLFCILLCFSLIYSKTIPQQIFSHHVNQHSPSSSFVASEPSKYFNSSEIVYSFSKIDFWFEKESDHQNYLQQEFFKDVVIAGIKIYNNEIYVSCPRWKPNSVQSVPATLSKLVTKNNETRLEPFPNWQMNQITAFFDNTSTSLPPINATLFSVLGFEIDALGRMWILDQGKVAGKEALEGSIKLIVYDLNLNQTIYTFTFPSESASLRRSFLNDLVVDTNRNLAYISDSGISVDDTEELLPNLFTLDIDTSVLRKFSFNFSMKEDPSVWIKPNGKLCLKDKPMKTGIDGIALSCDFTRLYWTPLSSRTLYAMETDYLDMYLPDSKYLPETVVNLGDKISASDGLICSSRGELFISSLETNSVYVVSEASYLTSRIGNVDKSAFNVSTLMKVVANQNDLQMGWVDTFAFDDNNNYLYFVANNLCDFLQNEKDFSQPNVFIWRVKTPNVRSYSNGCEALSRKFGVLEWILVGVGSAFFIASLVLILVVSKIVDLVNQKRKQTENRQYTPIEEIK